ncbi:MAG: hypothetical protein ACRDF9_11940, partial [Candidatus Limnocylindria bacterium]
MSAVLWPPARVTFSDWLTQLEWKFPATTNSGALIVAAFGSGVCATGTVPRSAATAAAATALAAGDAAGNVGAPVGGLLGDELTGPGTKAVGAAVGAEVVGPPPTGGAVGATVGVAGF